MSGLVFVLIAIVWFLVIFQQLRRGRLREKYAVLWVLVGLLVFIGAAFPTTLSWLARVSGFALPSNMLFLLAIVLLLGVALHLSVESSQLEEETRTLAEEVGMLRADVEALRAERDAAAPGTAVPPVEQRSTGATAPTQRAI